MTKAGACGLIGNLEAESDGFYTNRVEYLCHKRLKENGIKDASGNCYTDTTYTAAVDSGRITRAKFLNPLPGKQYGYGLPQWTTPTRKGGLYDLAKAMGVSIADQDMQFDYLIDELKNKFPSVLKVLKTTSSIKEASDIVLTKFEAPANASALKASRAKRGQDFYDYIKEETMTAAEKRATVVSKVKSREGKNSYTQSSKRTQVASGFSDCSALQWWAYQQVGLSIGDYTGAQIEKGEWVTKGGSYPDEKLLLPGDELFFASSSNNGRPYNVGHIEMYVGSGQISGHGSGIGPTRKNMIAYCQQRNATGAKYIGVKRYVAKDNSDGTTASATSTTTRAVAVYQRWLNTYYPEVVKKAVGALLEVDNAYGSKTHKAGLAVWKDVVNRKYGAKLTVGNANFADSCKAAAQKAVLQKGATGTLVVIIQGILVAKGYYAGGIDSEFGAMLEIAVKAFQIAKGLTADGQAGKDTWYALFN